MVTGCRKVKPKIVLVYIKKNINIIAQQTNNNTNKKNGESQFFTDQIVPYDMT